MKDRSLYFTLLFIAAQAINTTATATNQWSGVVTHITDGDTLWIQPHGVTSNTAPRKIRIDGIDAPESCQLYGSQSTSALKKLVASKTVTVVSKRFDDYGRDVAKVAVGDVDVGAWMVRNGHAWSYHSRYGAGPYRIEEDAATRARLGLFADTAAIEPRFFRREHGSCFLPKNASENPRKRYN